MTALAITIWQPWASLIALELKEFETRGWPTQYRGPLVIHAAKRPIVMAEVPKFVCRIFTVKGLRFDDLPLGAALCVCDLMDTIPTERIASAIGDSERAFGNFAPGRYAWKLANVRVFPQPIPMRGQQGLWVWEGPLP